MALPEKQPRQVEGVPAALEALYNWSYEPEIEKLRTLYANALDSQWVAVRDLDWESGVDREVFERSFSMAGIPVGETRFWRHLDPGLRWEVARRSAAFMLSNFLHGEQGALMVAAQLVNAVPHMDGKFYAATQTLDEARHVEVFAAYIRMLDDVTPIMPSLKTLLDRTLGTGSWMHKAVGMQIVVEGLALYVFRDMRNSTDDALLKKMLTYVSRDEARHTGYGIHYLSHVVGTLDDAQREDLEDFAFEATRLLIDSRSGTTMRQSALEIWRAAGLDPEAAFGEIAKERDALRAAGGHGVAGPVRGFVMPTLRRIGLMSERLEGHFLDLFVANFGPERARQLDLRVELPESLDAWLAQGA